jgi:hypothetical protein
MALIEQQEVIDAAKHAWAKGLEPSQYIEIIQPVQTDEKLEKCRFEYINACRTVTYPTPDTTKKDISDAYAVIKALQPIFGDVPFSNVKRGDSDGTD